MPVEVLLVHELTHARNPLSDLLAGLGDYEVVATKSTEAEALDWLDHHQGGWRLAVIDLVLDQGSGMGVIQRCRRTGGDARVVVFSKFVSPVIRDHCVRLGADAAFDKTHERRQFAAWCATIAPDAERDAPSP